MRKRWQVCTICLTGILLNVLSCWALTLKFDKPPGQTHYYKEQVSWLIEQPKDWPECANAYSISSSKTCKEIFQTSSSENYNTLASVEYYGFGWPMLSMDWVSAYSSLEGDSVRNDNPNIISAGIVMPSGLPSHYRGRLPLRPIFPGFYINTILWAVLVWLTILGPGQFKRWNRKRLGKCIACGYEIADLATCPECGSTAEPTAGA